MVALIIVACFLPSVIAAARGHCSFLAIFIVNLVGLAMTFFVFGWVIMLIALIWSCTSNTRGAKRRAADDMARALGRELAKREARS